MFERRLYYHVDWALLGAILALSLIGLLQIYSATAATPGPRIWVTLLIAIVLLLLIYFGVFA